MSRCTLCHVSMESCFLIGLASGKKVRANELAECVNLTEIWILRKKSETFLIEHHLERKFNISVNSMRSEGERDLVFHSDFRVSKFDV